MYAFLDRNIDDLAGADRHLLDAMRAWVHALTLAVEPAAAVAPRFADGGSRFDAAMRVLERGSTGTITFQRPCHSTVEEDEAVVLGLWALVRGDRLGAALATAGALVDDAGALVSAIQRADDSANH